MQLSYCSAQDLLSQLSQLDGACSPAAAAATGEPVHDGVPAGTPRCGRGPVPESTAYSSDDHEDVDEDGDDGTGVGSTPAVREDERKGSCSPKVGHIAYQVAQRAACTQRRRPAVHSVGFRAGVFPKSHSDSGDSSHRSQSGRNWWVIGAHQCVCGYGGGVSRFALIPLCPLRAIYDLVQPKPSESNVKVMSKMVHEVVQSVLSPRCASAQPSLLAQPFKSQNKPFPILSAIVVGDFLQKGQP